LILVVSIDSIVTMATCVTYTLGTNESSSFIGVHETRSNVVEEGVLSIFLQSPPVYVVSTNDNKYVYSMI